MSVRCDCRPQGLGLIVGEMSGGFFVGDRLGKASGTGCKCQQVTLPAVLIILTSALFLPNVYSPVIEFLWTDFAKIEIAASPERVWSVLSTPGILQKTHPFCRANPVDKWPGPGSVDYVHYYGGTTMIRRITDWHEGSGFDLVIDDVKNQLEKFDVSWRVSASENNSTQLSIRLTPSDVPIRSWHLPWILMWRYQSASYLPPLLAGFKYYIETGHPVTKNQFGPHSLSPASPEED